MLNPGKKVGGVAILIGGPKREGSDSSDDGEPMDAAGEGEQAAFKSLARALGADPERVNVEAGVKALRNYLTACGAMDDGDEPDADDEPDGKKGRPY